MSDEITVTCARCGKVLGARIELRGATRYIYPDPCAECAGEIGSGLIIHGMPTANSAAISVADWQRMQHPEPSPPNATCFTCGAPTDSPINPTCPACEAKYRCQQCNGSGMIGEDDCPDCDGEGFHSADTGFFRIR